MSREWTPAQQNAIDSRNGTVLVSAAAGSGKTAVLVQRVIERLTDKKNPTPVENLLIVTFTKAAAAEMRERISKELAKLIEKNPSDSFLKRQRMFLPNASICTMDSFCSRLVKENFQNLDIQPDFTLMSDNEHEMLKKEIVAQVLDEMYNNPSTEDSALLELFSNGRNDENLIKSILSIYEFSMAAPYPEKWIDEHFSFYFEDIPVEQSIWGKYALQKLHSVLSYIKTKIDKIILDAGDGKVGAYARSSLEPVYFDVERALELIENGGAWNEIKFIVDNLKFGKTIRFNADEKDDLFFEISERRDTIKEKYGDFDLARKIMTCTSAEFYEDMEYLRPIMQSFKNCVLNFSNRLFEVKKEKNSYYFSDVLHMTLSLLVTPNENGEMKRSELALELADTFDEILIDEFQDTNEAQNFLFDAISKDSKNKFMVGDIKQSIYRFRQANPEIFLRFKEIFEDFTGENYPAKISLDRNFRSRKGITEGINFFFNILMTKNLGDIDYKNGEQLVFAADYSETDNADTEVHIVEAPHPLASNLAGEARYIGKLIKDTIESGMTVGRKGEEHPVKYSDICILLRAAKSQAPVIARELTTMGIPVHYKKNGGFFDNAEIVTMLSLLRVIDNPVQDVPLMSVMLSPMFPFTEDDLAQMRINDRNGSIYTLLKNNYDTDEKVKYLLDTINILRTLSVTLSVSGLIRRIFEITSYDSVVGAMENGEKRELNLRMLINYADTYEKNGHYGLSGFIRYVDKLRENNFDLEDANLISESDNVVRIMTIHKSKGLEFPVVIVANCSGKGKAESEKALVDKTMGVATLRYDKDLHKELETQQYTSVKLKNEWESKSEALRVLYVAMTRAKEKLYLVGSLYSPDTAIRKLYCDKYTGLEDNSVPLYSCSNFMKWILLCMLYHPSMQEYATENGFSSCRAIQTDSKIKLVFGEAPDEEFAEELETITAQHDNELLTEIENKVSFVYPFDALSGVSLKYTASNMDTETKNQYLATENPAFMGEGELTPAQRGTLLHRFMEKCDFATASQNAKAELESLTENKAFSELEAQAINVNKITEFFKSDVYRRIQSAESFLREQEFTMSIPVSDINPDLPYTDEKAVVQGVIDALLINGKNGEIIDYKTDKVKTEEELIEKYRQQMQVYKRAAEECFGLEDVNVTLYSFSLSKEISVKL